MGEQIPEKGRSIFYRRLKPAWMFAGLMLLGCAALTAANLTSGRPVEVHVVPAVKIAMLVVMILVSFLLANVGARLDRKMLEGIFFQTVAHGALIAVITTLYVGAIWMIFTEPAASLAILAILAILLISWALGHFFLRIGELNQ